MGRTRWLSCAAVALLAAVLHLRTTGFAFVFDDMHLVVHNAFLREPWSPLTCFAHHFWHGTPFGAAYYRPVVVLSLAVNGRILGWGPAGFHLVNVLLHATNAALLVVLARRLGSSGASAVIAGLLFALHPVAAWPVGSIVARVDLLPALFVLLAWLQWRAAGEQAAGEAPGGRRVHVLGLGCFFLLALLAKESAAAFLVVPLLALRRPRNDAQGSRPARSTWAVLGLALGVYLAARKSVGLGLLMNPALIDPLTNPLGSLPLPLRLSGALRLTGRYLLYLFWPARFADSIDYFDPAALPRFLDAGVLVSLLFLLVWISAIVILWVRRDRLALPLAFSLASFLPASNLLVPIGSLYAQNFLYMPLLGLCLACGDLLGRVPFASRSSPPPRSSRHPRAALLPAGAILALLAALSWHEAGIWKDPIAYFSAMSERFPRYPNAHSGLGVALLDGGHPGEAIVPLRTALSLTDRSFEAHYNLGVALLLTRRDRAGLEEAYAHFRRVIEINPAMTLASLQAGRVLLLLDRAAEAAAQFRELARLHPDDVEIRSRLVDSLIRADLLDEARKETVLARRDFPESAWFDFCLARIKARTSSRAESLALLETAIAKDRSALDWVAKVRDFDAYRGTPDFDRILSIVAP
ncbi:MAG TPA: hypothetical protein VKF61_04190 [Candidatus Polarisedimenticolia bacterium]|nr:hypothetical protein [Candidatus Polarisedimenticolia bacterium]